MCKDPALRSNTSVCLKITDADIAARSIKEQWDFAKKMVTMLEEEQAAYDLGAYRDAPPGLRIWAGATIQRANLAALFPWLDWAFARAKTD